MFESLQGSVEQILIKIVRTYFEKIVILKMSYDICVYVLIYGKKSLHLLYEYDKIVFKLVHLFKLWLLVINLRTTFLDVRPSKLMYVQKKSTSIYCHMTYSFSKSQIWGKMFQVGVSIYCTPTASLAQQSIQVWFYYLPIIQKLLFCFPIYPWTHD